jgi:hypothetical protein
VTAAVEQAAAATAETLTSQKVDAFVEAVHETAAAMRRWAAVDQLVRGVTLIPWSQATEPCDDWVEVLVQAAAFAHVRVSPDCRGYTHWSSGGAGCGCCGWGMSARMHDVGTPGSARFSQAALARVGQAIALAVDELVQALFEAVLP